MPIKAHTAYLIFMFIYSDTLHSIRSIWLRMMLYCDIADAETVRNVLGRKIWLEPWTMRAYRLSFTGIIAAAIMGLSQVE